MTTEFIVTVGIVQKNPLLNAELNLKLMVHPQICKNIFPVQKLRF